MGVAQFLSPTVAIFVLALLNYSSAFQVANNPRPVVVTSRTTTTTTSSSSLDAVSRREALAVASSATMLVAGGVFPLDAMAASTAPPDTKQFAFNGIYKDPKHPKGFRIIAAKASITPQHSTSVSVILLYSFPFYLPF